MEYTLRCELCQNKQPKHDVHICESGHVICVNCNECPHEHLNSEYSNGDAKKITCNVKRKHSRKDLAGGDNKQMNTKKDSHRSRGERTEVLESNKSEIDFLPILSLDTTFLYKNVNYTPHDNEELSVSYQCDNYNTMNNITEEKYTRPIVCPLMHCQKTIVLDSILKHFAFDHPKISTLTFETKKPLRIILKPYNLTTNTQCIAVMNPVGIESPMLLMAAKVLNSCSKIDMDKELSEKKSDSRIHSQRKSRRSRHCNNKIGFFSDYDILMLPEMEMDIIIWICRLNNFGHLYSLTVRREYALSYSYVGEGLYIQNAQDPINVYRSPESLIIRHHSIAKLQDDNSDLNVYICIIK